MRFVRRKPYRVRRVGERGAVVGVPTPFLERHGLDIGDECYLLEDERGNLVLTFKNSDDYARVAVAAKDLTGTL